MSNNNFKLIQKFKIDSLINFLLKCFSRISEPAEDLGHDLHDKLKFDLEIQNIIALTEFGVKNGFKIC